MNIIDSIIKRSPRMARSAPFQAIPEEDTLMTDTPEARGDDLVNGIEAEDRTLEGLVIKGPKLDKYYGNRKKLEY